MSPHRVEEKHDGVLSNEMHRYVSVHTIQGMDVGQYLIKPAPECVEDTYGRKLQKDNMM